MYLSHADRNSVLWVQSSLSAYEEHSARNVDEVGGQCSIHRRLHVGTDCKKCPIRQERWRMPQELWISVEARTSCIDLHCMIQDAESSISIACLSIPEDLGLSAQKSGVGGGPY